MIDEERTTCLNTLNSLSALKAKSNYTPAQEGNSLAPETNRARTSDSVATSTCAMMGTEYGSRQFLIRLRCVMTFSDSLSSLTSRAQMESLSETNIKCVVKEMNKAEDHDHFLLSSSY